MSTVAMDKAYVLALGVGVSYIVALRSVGYLPTATYAESAWIWWCDTLFHVDPLA